MKIIKKILLGIGILLLALILAYLAGPKVNYESYDNLPLAGTYSIQEIETNIAKRNTDKRMKKNNEEEIVWFQGKQKTEYSFIYLHGFSASHEEGAPVHENIAKRFGGNLFLSRLPQHGLDDEEAFVELTPKQMVDYAKEAIKIGKSLGDKVIVISCSTGGTLSSYLAAEDKDIFAQVMFSPNFAMYNESTKLMVKPWGLQLARKIKGGKYHEWNTPMVARPYWYHKYRLEGVAALQDLVNKTTTDQILKQNDQGLFVGYFYKDEKVRDFTVSLDRIKEFENLVSTPDAQKKFMVYPDGSAHVFMSPLFNDNWQKVETDVAAFLENQLQMKPYVSSDLVLKEDAILQ